MEINLKWFISLCSSFFFTVLLMAIFQFGFEMSVLLFLTTSILMSLQFVLIDLENIKRENEKKNRTKKRK